MSLLIVVSSKHGLHIIAWCIIVTASTDGVFEEAEWDNNSKRAFLLKTASGYLLSNQYHRRTRELFLTMNKKRSIYSKHSQSGFKFLL